MTGLFKSNPRRHLRKLIKQKKYDEALKYGHDIEKNLEHDPDVAFIIGTVYFMKGDIKNTLSYMNKTLECCEKIKEIDPKNKALKEIEDELKKMGNI